MDPLDIKLGDVLFTHLRVCFYIQETQLSNLMAISKVPTLSLLSPSDPCLSLNKAVSLFLGDPLWWWFSLLLAPVRPPKTGAPQPHQKTGTLKGALWTPSGVPGTRAELLPVPAVPLEARAGALHALHLKHRTTGLATSSHKRVDSPLSGWGQKRSPHFIFTTQMVSQMVQTHTNTGTQ